ncbi:MAG: MerR family transcriptional regulator [Flavobacteriales bacterium]
MPTNPFATRFSISDLENLSGVKAHTIRVWERRYGLIRPARTGTNIRHYNVEDLRDLLNIAYLNTHGVKISKIASMTNELRESRVREIGNKAPGPSALINELVMSMLHFDEPRFEGRCNAFAQQHGFRALAEQVFLPLMTQVGLLWQSKNIRPAHEHFVSNLVRRRIEAETHAQPVAAAGNTSYVLYLREMEVHELGILYANYLLRSTGKAVIYLGQSVPVRDLAQLVASTNGPVVMVTVLTTNYNGGTAPFLKDLHETTQHERVTHWVTGPQASVPEGQGLPSGIRLFPHFNDLVPLLVA